MDDANDAMSSCLSKGEKNLVGAPSVNGPDRIIVSGMVDVVKKVLLELGKKCVYLQGSHAFQSPLMRRMKAEFRHIIGLLDTQQSLTTPIVSTMAGRVMLAGETINMEHWVKHLTIPVFLKMCSRR